ncbi:tetratricopeptide repeat protein [Aquabacter spiritensis]|uniref:Ancillary SecYEG translocon subunit/Cell division coordinator CpoB TPR domain-containing protein n=1 Tax=Aquabacter spiritensis TaxID=933073 RepID=A0A4R3M1W3_9HYPH|nr:tetratricopeptide repeat protein [Aquabacter spiritensis]TCT05095.1 hypothetical protein EDC64_105126 [Aquabacter spiritensis]
MTDIFHEIEDDLRRDRFRRLWDRFGLYLILLAVAVVAAAGAWSGYRYWSLQQAQASGARFEAANALLDEGKTAEAQAALAALAQDGTAGYRVLARFRAAGALAAQDKAASAAAFDALAADTAIGALGREVAQIRAAQILVDTAPLAEIVQRIQPLAEGNGALRHSARALLALAQFKAGDLAAANKTAQWILDDPEVPPGIRNQAQLLRTLTAAAVPPAAAPAPGAATQ